MTSNAASIMSQVAAIYTGQVCLFGLTKRWSLLLGLVIPEVNARAHRSRQYESGVM